MPVLWVSVLAFIVSVSNKERKSWNCRRKRKCWRFRWTQHQTRHQTRQSSWSASEPFRQKKSVSFHDISSRCAFPHCWKHRRYLLAHSPKQDTSHSSQHVQLGATNTQAEMRCYDVVPRGRWEDAFSYPKLQRMTQRDMLGQSRSKQHCSPLPVFWESERFLQSPVLI